MTEKCFNKCITKPGTNLDSSETVFHLSILRIYFLITISINR